LFYYYFIGIRNKWGAVGVEEASTCTIKKCEFIGLDCDRYSYGGGVYLEIDGGRTYSFEDCNFTNCFGDISGSEGHGGGIYVKNGGNSHTGTLQVINCKFDLCKGGEGGAISNKGFLLFLFYLFIFYLITLRCTTGNC
jgi:hypothetical protein